MKNFNIKSFYEWPLTTRLLIMSLVCASTFYLGYLWDLSSLKTELVDVKQQEEELKQQFELTLKKESSLQKELAQFSQLKILVQQWQNKLVKYSELPELLNEILRIGAHNNLYFSLFNPGEEMKEQNYFKVPIKVVVVGGYHQLGEFMSQISNMLWTVVIGDFSITTEEKNSVLDARSTTTPVNENMLTTALTLEIYYLPEANRQVVNEKKESGQMGNETGINTVNGH